MDFTLTRIDSNDTGIYSTLVGADGTTFFTLEHAYPDGSGGYAPKVPPGVYTCVLGPHRLHGMASDFSTYEITGVAGHLGILFHWGNYNVDSDGCVLVGEARAAGMVINSRSAFAQFIALQNGVTTFTLTVA